MLGVSRVLLLSLCFFLMLANLQAEEIEIPYEDKQLRAELNLAEGKSLSDGVVVVLHGTFAHNQMEIIQTLGELLGDEGYSTLAINLSFGMDKRPSAMLDCNIEHQHTHEGALSELKAWFAWLEQQQASKAALLGHSRGGNQATWFAVEENPVLLEKLIAVAPMTWDAEQAATDYTQRYNKPLSEVLAEARKLVAGDRGEIPLTVPGLLYCENAKASAESIYSYYRDEANKHTPSLLPQLEKPTLVVLGSADEVVQDLPAELAKLQQENLSTVTVDGADHFFRDLYAEEVVEAIVEFLAW